MCVRVFIYIYFCLFLCLSVFNSFFSLFLFQVLDANRVAFLRDTSPMNDPMTRYWKTVLTDPLSVMLSTIPRRFGRLANVHFMEALRRLQEDADQAGHPTGTSLVAVSSSPRPSATPKKAPALQLPQLQTPRHHIQQVQAPPPQMHTVQQVQPPPPQMHPVQQVTTQVQQVQPQLPFIIQSTPGSSFSTQHIVADVVPEATQSRTSPVRRILNLGGDDEGYLVQHLQQHQASQRGSSTPRYSGSRPSSSLATPMKPYDRDFYQDL